VICLFFVLFHTEKSHMIRSNTSFKVLIRNHDVNFKYSYLLRKVCSYYTYTAIMTFLFSISVLFPFQISKNS